MPEKAIIRFFFAYMARILPSNKQRINPDRFFKVCRGFLLDKSEFTYSISDGLYAQAISVIVGRELAYAASIYKAKTT